MPSLVHSTARVCACSVEQALAHLGSAAGMARWNLGLWNCREVEPGLVTGQSLFDGAIGWARVQVDAARGVVDYRVGADPSALLPRIRASVLAGETLGHPEGSCLVTLEAWRTAGMDDERWNGLVRTHETEIDLIRAQLSSAPTHGAAMPAVIAVAPSSGRMRRRISSGSPWESVAGYSRAIVDGDWIFVSGTIGQDFATMTIPESATAQTEQALDTIARALSDAHSSLMDVVRVRVFVTERSDVPAISAVLKRRLGTAAPANTTICCALAVDGARVEIEVTARVNSTSAPLPGHP